MSEFSSDKILESYRQLNEIRWNMPKKKKAKKEKPIIMRYDEKLCKIIFEKPKG